MAQFTYQIMPGRHGVITAEGALADVYRRDPQYVEVLAPEQVEAMKGAELDVALAQRGLPTGGRVAQRKARLRGDAEEPPTELTAEAPDPGVLPVEDGVPPVPESPQPAAAAPSTDRDAVGADPTPAPTSLDRDAEQTTKEN